MSPVRRIGVVTSSFPRWPGDLAGNFVLGLAKALVERGHDVEVLAPEPAERPAWDDDADWLAGVRLVPVPYARPRRFEKLFYGAGVPDNVARTPALAGLAPLALAALCTSAARRASRWDGAVSEWLVPSGLVVSSLGPKRPPHFAIAHSGDVHLLRRLPFGAIVARRIAADAEQIGFVAELLQREFCDILGAPAVKHVAGKLSILPMGIDEGGFRPSEARDALRARLGLRGFTVLYLGRLVPIKGVDSLLAAIARISEATLVVAGDGPCRRSLEEQARASGLDARFLGAVDERERADLMAACDAISVPSRVLEGGRHEGMPMVVVEAMCAGLPVVATSTGGIPEVVREGQTGLLVSPDSPWELAAALTRLREDPQLRARIVAGGRQEVLSRSWDATASRVVAVLENGRKNRDSS